MSKERNILAPLKIDLSSTKGGGGSGGGSKPIQSPLLMSPGSSSSSSTTSLNVLAGDGGLSRNKSSSNILGKRRDSSNKSNAERPKLSPRHSPRNSPRSSPGLSPRVNQGNGNGNEEDGGSYFTLHRPNGAKAEPDGGSALRKYQMSEGERERERERERESAASNAAVNSNAGSSSAGTYSSIPPNLSPTVGRPQSPVRALSNSYAPARIPSHQSIKGKSPQSPVHDDKPLSPKQQPSKSSRAGSISTPITTTTAAAVTAAANNDESPIFSKRKDAHLSYLAQEPVYIHKMTSAAVGDDYYVKGLSSVGDNSDVLSDDDDDDDEEDEDSISEVQSEVMGFGGVGTSFDDEYTDLGSSYPFLESTYNTTTPNGTVTTKLPTTTATKVQSKITPANFESIEGGTPEIWRERLEWQAMLASVLTGEVFRAEKRRIRQPKKSGNGIDEEEMWLGLKAKVSGRTVIEQKKILDYSRSTVTDALERVMNFKIENPNNISAEEVLKQVDSVLQLLYRCEGLYRTSHTLRAENVLYASEAFTAKVQCLQAWKSITDAINQELELLRQWTGNNEIDPSRAPEKSSSSSGENNEEDDDDSNHNRISRMTDERITLVESILKQDDLSNIFDRRISKRLGPLIEKAREATIKHSDLFLQLGLPLFNNALLHLMVFPITLIREIIQMRLTYARRLVNPTMMIVDQMILDFQAIIKHALTVMDRNIKYTSPILDKGWIFPTQIDESFNSTLLDCVNFYLDLLNKKFLDGGRSSKSLFRAYKETEQLEQHYTFLLGVGKSVEGGDIAVAELITSLESKILTRLLTYWEHQMKGPQTWAPQEIERWFATTMEIIRSFQRKLLRFHKILADAYENSTEYSIQPAKTKVFMNLLRQSDHFLVYTGTFEKYGIYAIADPYLKDKPSTVRSILSGYSRIQSSNVDHVSYVMIFCIEEPLVWEGEIVNLDMQYFDIDMKPGRMRLITEGGSLDLKRTRKEVSALTGGGDIFDVAVDTKSHITGVDRELAKIRKLFFRLSTSVITNCILFRRRCKPYGCQETVYNMFVFARELGQRGISVMDASRRGTVAIKLINLCIEWVSFICDDCVPTENKTFRWTVVALEFAMVMTRGVNIVAISTEQFAKLRVKVADCMTLLISHFDIIGARSKAAQHSNDILRRNKYSNIAVKDDDELVAMLREETVKKLEKLEQLRQDTHSVGKVLDDSNGDTEFLTYLASAFSNVQIRWQQGRFIGGGTFGSVYAAVNLDTGGVMAVKEIRLQDTQSIRHILKSIKDEMTVLEILSHPNVVQYYGVEVHRDRVFIFMEYCQGGSLAGLLEYGRIEDEQVIQVYTLQMLEGLAYLHQSGIVHRDIKPENILLDHNGVVKFVDFGAAKVIAKTGKTRQGSITNTNPNPSSDSINGNKTKLNSMTGTPMYMSPEVITGSDSGRHGSIDIWSLGCCVLEMATGRRPWANLDNEWAIMYHIAAGHLPQLPSHDQLSPEGQQFLMKTLERDPNKRPSAVELLTDSWMVSIRNIVLGYSATSDDSTVSSPSEV